MKHLTTQAIVLNRTNFGESGRIITFLTPEQGKLRVMARGVRKVKSKLAGGIELFSVSDISYLIGRGEIYTLTSSRLIKHFGDIVKDSDRTQAAYDFIKQIDKNTADNPEPAYFELLADAFEGLDDHAINLDLICVWFGAQLIKLAGHTPNLRTDSAGQPLDQVKKYSFDYQAMCFKPGRTFDANAIKFLRLCFAVSPKQLKNIRSGESYVKPSLNLVQALTKKMTQ